MLLKIVHIVDSLARTNFGIYNAALFTSEYMRKKHFHQTQLWVTTVEDGSIDQIPFSVSIKYLGESVSDDHLLILLKGISPQDIIFVSHGCWRLPTRLGMRLHKLGFRWIYAPHGMLEPWSMQQKKWKKQIYFNLFEKRLAQKADAIRAVSYAEQKNLEVMFKKQVMLIENGIQIPDFFEKTDPTVGFLFMARLHYKKGVLPLARAWAKTMQGEKYFKLIIAGPDEGELRKIQPYLSTNLIYAGPVYGKQKEDLLKQSHYFVLPSFSEGFPTSVVEAMGYGLIPVISKACNFPQVFDESLGYEVIPEEQSISDVLSEIKNKSFDKELSAKNRLYIQQNNSEPVLAEKILALYKRVLSQK